MLKFTCCSKQFYLLFALFLLLNVSSQPAFAASMSASDQKTFSAAVEDFRFSDFTAAITKFKQLLQSYPNDAKVTEYLGRAYEESGDAEAAVHLYGAWLKASGNEKAEAARFAWIGLANAMIKLKRDESARSSLAQWVSYHPSDAVASVLYGSTLLRMKRYDESGKVWADMLNNADVAAKDQAAAHYYQAFLAYNRGDLRTQREQAALSLQKDPNGPYAAPAKQFMEATPARTLGLTASANVEVNYTSNVELLPDFSTPTAGGSKADVTTQATLSLLYNLEKFSLGYAYNGSFHSKRSDLDLGYHSLYGLWSYGLWFAMPRVEYMTLGNTFLTNSFGGDFGWGNSDMRVIYGLRYNQYNKNLNGTDLRHLGGLTNSLTGEVFGKHGEWSYAGNAGLTYLASKGDTTYLKSDSYWQSSLGGVLGWSRDALTLQGIAATYYRKYKEAATTTPLLVRKDSNITTNVKVSWMMLQREAYRMRLTGNSGWQKNNSNDSTKSYKEWHAGAGMQVDW